MAQEEELITEKKEGLSTRTWVLMAMVVIVTVLAVLMVPEAERPAPPLPEPPAAAPEQAELRPPASAAESAAPLRDGDRARAIITRLRAETDQPDADSAYAEAQRLHGEGHLDDAYLLYRLAARNGHAQAALALATQADPAFYAAATSNLLSPEPALAHKWYGVAIAAGSREAETRLQDLRNRVEQDAAAGDERAQRLMLQWR